MKNCDREKVAKGGGGIGRLKAATLGENVN